MTIDFGNADTHRRCLRVLRMVHELHKRGYQRLRICPGMAANGRTWRCAVTHVGNVPKSRGAVFLNPHGDVIRYDSGQEADYFGWRQARHDTVVKLADDLLNFCPWFAHSGKGRDWAYAGWYVEMLGLAERGAFPIAHHDSYGTIDTDWLPTTISEPWARLPTPPGGEADDPDRR